MISEEEKIEEKRKLSKHLGRYEQSFFKAYLVVALFTSVVIIVGSILSIWLGPYIICICMVITLTILLFVKKTLNDKRKEIYEAMSVEMKKLMDDDDEKDTGYILKKMHNVSELYRASSSKNNP